MEKLETVSGTPKELKKLEKEGVKKVSPTLDHFIINIRQTVLFGQQVYL
jgi:hypothetical protein